MTGTKKIMEALPDFGLDAVLLFDEKNILYASGFHASDAAVLVTRDRAFLFTDFRYIEAAEKGCNEGVCALLCDRENPILKTMRRHVQELSLAAIGIEEEHISFSLHKRVSELLNMELLPAEEMLRKLRGQKSKWELDSMIAAQRIAERSLEKVLPLIKPGISEREIAAELTYNMLRFGAEGNSFPPICLTGKNTSLPHGVPGDSLVRAGDFVTMDFGCVKDGYCSDMTRTVAVGFASEEMKNVYYTVLAAQKAGIAAARPGVPGCEIHKAAADVIDAAGFGKYFGHGFGHGVGLDIHESPNASPANTEPMPEGCVISAEPGIYIPDKFGVRIEDVLYLCGDGNINLTLAPRDELIIL